MPQHDPYQLLGLTRSASAAEIKSAYRKLAKKLHPDLNPGRKDIEQKFKDVTAAYDLLSDAKKRARFDAGEIDGQGNERGFGYGGNAYGGDDPFAGMRSGGRRSSSSHYSGFNPEDIFAEFFGGGGKRSAPARGQDVNYELEVPFREACVGGKKRVTLAGGKTVDVNLPAGTEDGEKLRLRGLGQAGRAGAGDALVTIKVQPDPYFRREGNDLHLDVPVALHEALLGASVKVPTLSGTVAVKLPPRANTGTVMRLKGKGIARPKGEAGDLFLTLKIMLPEQGRDDLAAAAEKWAKKHDYDPRQKLDW